MTVIRFGDQQRAPLAEIVGHRAHAEHEEPRRIGAVLLEGFVKMLG